MKKHILRSLLLFCMTLMLSMTALAAESGYCGGEGDGTNLRWTLDDAGALTISGVGKMADYDYDIAPWDDPDSEAWDEVRGTYGGSERVSQVIIEDGVTTIGYGAFSGCHNLCAVMIPDSIFAVGKYAFRACHRMKQISIPNGVVEIHNGAFWFCPSLESISIPVSVRKIGVSVFWECDLLTDIYYAGSEEQWEQIEKEEGYDAGLFHHVTVHYEEQGENTDQPTDNVTYSAAIEGGSGSGQYSAYTEVTIIASIPDSGKWFRFKGWTGADGLNFVTGNSTTATATFIMPERDVILTASYDEGFFNDPVYTAPTFEDYVTATSALIHEYQYVENAADPDNEYATGRIIVDASQVLPDLSGFNVAQIVVDSNHNYLIQFYSAKEAKDCADYLDSLPYISYAEPDIKVKADSTYILNPTIRPSISTSSNSWGVSAIGADTYAASLRERGISANITVAVIDTGIDSSHPFLKERVLTGYDLVDDDAIPQDGTGHGTHVSGTVVDCTPGLNIKILPVRVLNDVGEGYSSTIGEGIKYAVDHGANVINLSLGGPQCDYIDSSISYAVSHNVTVVAAAGNENTDTADYSPAHNQHCITVAAVDSNGIKADFSNYGESIDIAAPGVDIKSSIPGGGFASWQGTSMAAPHVAAAAALLLYENSHQTPAQIETKLRDMAVDLGDTGWDRYYGAGFLKLSGADSPIDGPIENPPEIPPRFSDVPKSAYYYEAVVWAVKNGITNGTTSSTFSPNDTCSTAQILTFIWRASGSPEPSSSAVSEVSASSPFVKALSWANENGIRGAFSSSSANSPCTRAAAMTYMWNDAGKPSSGDNPFDDVSVNSGYATAVSWGVNRGITNGTTATTFSPNKSCTRAHIITFLYRYYVESV